MEINKECTVAEKLQNSVITSFRRPVRGGAEASQLALLQETIESSMLSNVEDRWVWSLNGEGVFRVKDVRVLLDDSFLPNSPTATRWVKHVPIKVNVFACKVFLDRLPTRSNLVHRGVQVSDHMCSICSSAPEDSSHLFFGCRLVTDVTRLICRWWNLDWSRTDSYSDWLVWFNSVRLSSNVKRLLEGVFTLLGGVFGNIGINCFSLQPFRVKMSFLMILFLDRIFGAILDVVVSLDGIVGCNTLI